MSPMKKLIAAIDHTVEIQADKKDYYAEKC